VGGKRARRRQLISERIALYKTEEDLGTWGAGQGRWVYDEQDKEHFVFVTIPPEALPNARARRAFKRQLEHSQKLDHPRIVAILKGGTDDGDGRPYLIQEAKQNPLDASQVAAINSLTLRPEPHIRHNGFLALARAPYAPERSAILSRALNDEDDQIRKESTSWLLPDGNQPPELGAIAMARLLRCAADPESRGHVPAKEVFDRLNQAHAVPLLLDALAHPEQDIRDEAGARLQAVAGQRVEYDPEQDPRYNRRAFTVWWWKRTHPDGSLEGLLRDLGADNPSVRWRSAKEAGSLPLPEVRDRLAKALASERAAWVQDEQLRALQRFSPDHDFGAAKRMKPAQRKACVERALRWWAAQRAREVQQGGPR